MATMFCPIRPYRVETTMKQLDRRDVLLRSGAAAGIAMLHGRAFARSGPSEKVIPWTDQPVPVPPPLANVVKV